MKKKNDPINQDIHKLEWGNDIVQNLWCHILHITSWIVWSIANILF